MRWDGQSVLERCAVSAATAWGFYLMARFVNHRWHMASLEQQLKETQALLDHEREKRKADRVGRIRAEQELRVAKVEAQQLQLQFQMQEQQQIQQLLREMQGGDSSSDEEGEGEGASGSAAAKEAEQKAGEDAGELSAAAAEEEVSNRQQPASAAAPVDEVKRAAVAATAVLAAAGAAMPAFPFRPIGHLQSVFSERNGTPRQPQLVPAARSRLVLSRDVPAACLEGLEQYSHCWVLYVFHANTDLAKYLSPDRSGLKAKIHVPRLNGGRMGVLATRSPHRPSPIGLSTAQIISVEGNTLVLGGADIVDGSPVLDIKPYVPFCDCLPAARAPAWVQAEADDEPLAVGEVVVGQTAAAAITRAWQARRSHSMYGSAEDYLDLVRQVLSRDIRSVHQRLNVKPTTAAAASTSTSSSSTTKSPPAASSSSSSAGSTACSTSAASASTTATTSTPVPHAGATFALMQPQPPQPEQRKPAGGAEGPGQYHVVLEGVYISYDISPAGVVEVHDAWVDPITAK
ncbi:hypothetical protein Agub_g3607 [Astrephomene gubernaculifera]|uniref:TsaA-like domain-containing protein n=1 Tax=Astrephomene gubernaculifera TaxID=47775 RepID=A0AAD3DMU7_9CHLO|nr:hypothetical protein Agub_g3607 [Astrephomene gubernaculifera]